QRQSEEIAEKFKNTSSAVGIKEKISKIDQYQGRSKKKSSSVATLNNDSRTVSNEEIQAKLPPLPIGKEIGPYSVKKTLGEGTFGKVRLCQHKFSNELVAIKTIQKADVKTAKQRNSVQREVRLMKLLYHPHIIHVYDINENDDEISIVMEYASGGELFDYIVSRGMLQENESRKFFRQMISAVDYCHQNSVIHRDLKPENMLLDSNKNIKLIDFGFGNTYHSERQLDTYCGSPFYAAPEMIKGQPYCGPEVDVWSLGVILYALLAGRLPFEAPVISDLYQEIGRGEFIIPKHFSPDSAHLIQRMLTVNSKKRASMEEVFNHKWINIGFDTPPKSYVYPREKTVNFPNKDSLAELVDFGISETEIRRVLSQEVGKHPISSLYHMVDEARQRKLAKQAIAAVPHPPERSSSKRSVHTSQCDNSGSCSNSYYSESECKSSSINERFLNKSASSSSSGMEVSKVRTGVYRPNQDSLSDKVQQSTIPPKNSYAPININNDQGIDQMNGTSHGEYNIQRREYHPGSSDPSYQHLQQQLLSQQRKCHHHTENSDISSSKLENGPAQYLKELQLEENICTPSLKNINNKNKFPKSEQGFSIKNY
ncbi:protein kinase, AMP-activated, alpha 2 catalytic subunit, partial [Lobulomyces angularis]